jgi:two-component system response regulator VicR
VTASILLIEDDVTTINDVQPGLIQDGYTVFLSQPGVEAIRRMLIENPDLVILGINSQEKDWQFCHRLLTFLDRPLLLLLSTRNKLDRVKALEMGADDCMLKPILVIELAARARALLRRSGSLPSRRRQSFFVDEGLVIDLTRREVRLNDHPVGLTPTEFRVLACLAKHVGEVLPHDRILNQVWGPDYGGGRSILKLYIHNLRQKLEPDPSQPRRILTRRGEGYIFQRLAVDQ